MIHSLKKKEITIIDMTRNISLKVKLDWQSSDNEKRKNPTGLASNKLVQRANIESEVKNRLLFFIKI